ncbi:hypothetical protein GALMADRAFT_148812 [Galerina marginata CBS 339.88]|uniref:Uncharacterized protein n=1 Tax=Galerina marginata (strain CBS 339.88) TaxID=685588 RepID=A0A067S5Z1_GALM3|nr:hypothetical protein GALMADRAFT_148812 [Galerina marginata CBS 339.88]
MSPLLLFAVPAHQAFTKDTSAHAIYVEYVALDPPPHSPTPDRASPPVASRFACHVGIVGWTVPSPRSARSAPSSQALVADEVRLLSRPLAPPPHPSRVACRLVTIDADVVPDRRPITASPRSAPSLLPAHDHSPSRSARLARVGNVSPVSPRLSPHRHRCPCLPPRPREPAVVDDDDSRIDVGGGRRRAAVTGTARFSSLGRRQRHDWIWGSAHRGSDNWVMTVGTSSCLRGTRATAYVDELRGAHASCLWRHLSHLPPLTPPDDIPPVYSTRLSLPPPLPLHLPLPLPALPPTVRVESPPPARNAYVPSYPAPPSPPSLSPLVSPLSSPLSSPLFSRRLSSRVASQLLSPLLASQLSQFVSCCAVSETPHVCDLNIHLLSRLTK